MNKNNANSEAWDACPDGEIRSLVERQKSGQARARMMRIAGTATASLVLVVLVTFAASRFVNQTVENIGAITCAEAQELLADYIAEKLDAEQATQVKAHLDKCPNCDERHRQMIEDLDRRARGRFLIPHTRVAQLGK